MTVLGSDSGVHINIQLTCMVVTWGFMDVLQL